MQHAAYFTIFLIGVLSTSGEILRLRPLYGIGTILAASPLPDPLTGDRNYEQFASRGKFEIVFADGQRLHVPLSRTTVSMISGPHSRKVIYFTGLGLAPLLPEKISVRVLEYAFCHEEGPFGGKKIFEQPVRSIKLNLVYDKGGPAREWNFQAVCR